jgi:peptidoglycan/LPS O-acetylase OafA/YrhL
VLFDQEQYEWDAAIGDCIRRPCVLPGASGWRGASHLDLTTVAGLPVTRRKLLSSVNKALRWLTTFLIVLALACTAALLTSDAKIRIPFGISASVISAAPLLLIGVSCLVFLAVLRPRWSDLVKNILLTAAFLLWGVVQLMEQSALSKTLGDIVIALYVLDLAWVILAGVNSREEDRGNSVRSDSSQK